MKINSTGRRKIDADDLRRMNIPDQFWRVKLQHVQDGMRPIIENYLTRFDVMAEKGAGLMLWGEAGRGKTALAVLVAKEARARGYTGFFITPYELRELVRLKAEFDGEVSFLERCREVDVLILDHVKEDDLKSTHYFGLSDLRELLLYRGSRLKITVLTTDLEPRKPPLLSLTNEVQQYMVPVKVEGKDMRGARLDDLVQAVIPKKES